MTKHSVAYRARRKRMRDARKAYRKTHWTGVNNMSIGYMALATDCRGRRTRRKYPLAWIAVGSMAVRMPTMNTARRSVGWAAALPPAPSPGEDQ